jgi:PAS domain S-box-containing protein
LEQRIRALEETAKGQLIQTAVDAAGDAIGMSTADGHHFYQNKSFDHMFGYTLEEVSRLHPRRLYVDKHVANKVFETTMAGGSWHGEIKMVAKNGRRFPVLLRADAIKDENGDVIGLIGVHTDITERKRMETALKESESRFRSIIEDSQDGIIFFDGKTRKILFGNGAMAGLLGCSKEDLAGRTISSLHPPEEWASVEQEFQRHVTREVSFSTGIPVIRDDGSVFYADISSSLTTLEGRSYFSAFFRDITERKLAELASKEAEEALRESEEKFRAIASLSPAAIAILKSDEQGERFLYVNAAWETLTGYPRDDAMLLKPNDMVHPDYACAGNGTSSSAYAWRGCFFKVRNQNHHQKRRGQVAGFCRHGYPVSGCTCNTDDGF